MRRMKRCLSLVLVLALCVLLTGCFYISGYLPSTQEPTDDGLTTYHVTVRTHSGQYLKDVGVRIFADTNKTDLIWYDKTDDQGKMSFIADTYDGYVVALENIPDGYVAADYYPLTGVDNEIVLAIGLQSGVDLNTVDLKLGSGMVDLTVDASDGARYNLSELLASKKAVALYFFDSTAAGQLSCLEEAWKACSDEVAVLALNPADADISAFVQDLSLPVALCDSAWVEALDLYDYPTLVMVDRYGVISLVHSGIIDDAEVFRDVFTFFARNDYTAEVVHNIEDIVGKSLQGTAGNPYEQDGSTDLMISVASGDMVYYNLYRVGDMILQLRSANAWILYEGEAYYPENGVITLALDVPDPFTPVSLGVGNAGSHTELFVGRFSYQPGTHNNPIEVDLGTFTVTLEEGDDDGLCYIYKAVKPGILRLSCLFATEGVNFEYSIANRNTGLYVSSVDGMIIDEITQEQYMLLDVSANDEVLIRVGVLPEIPTGEENGEESGQEGEVSGDPLFYAAATFTMQLGYEGSEEGPDDPVPPPGTRTDFSVTVQDADGTPLSGVDVLFTDLSGTTTMITDENGTAYYSNTLGGVDVELVPLPGYTAHKTEYHLTGSTNDVSVVFIGTMEGETVPVGEGVAYLVSTGDNYAVMHAGAVTYFLFTPTEAGHYSFTSAAQLSFWGTDVEHLADRTGETFAEEAGFSLNIYPEDLGKSYILGMTGEPYATLTITRVGEIRVPETEPQQ